MMLSFFRKLGLIESQKWLLIGQIGAYRANVFGVFPLHFLKINKPMEYLMMPQSETVSPGAG